VNFNGRSTELKLKTFHEVSMLTITGAIGRNTGESFDTTDVAIAAAGS
jgi:hypothetical protein